MAPATVAIGSLSFGIETAAAATVARPNPAEMIPDDALQNSAAETLMRALAEETGWIRVHAAEALIGLGQTEPARVRYEAELRNTAPDEFEIGTWRVLAASAPLAERRGWETRIEARLRERRADLATAVESLDKLGCRLSGPALAIVREMAATAPEQETLLPLWALQLAGEPGALERIVGKLQSSHPVARRRAGYVLRWLQPADAKARTELTRAALAESPGTDVQVYLLTAALAMRVAPEHEARWIAQLQTIMLSDSSEPHMRFEASHALAARLTPADLEGLAPMLQARHGDIRIGAAMILLHVLGWPAVAAPR